ncbi:MAG: urea ABC transporter permease subunit UrtB [Marinobacter sp.]|nr:urea ABC transporter permease subunit UrtB [Marinobacter sp.]
MKALRFGSLMLLAWMLWTPALADDFERLLQPLTSNNMAAKAQVVQKLADTGDARALVIFEAILDGNLHFRRDTGELVLASLSGNMFQLRDPYTGESLGEAGRREVSRVNVNNAIRSDLRTRRAALQLEIGTATDRRNAARRLMSQIDEELRPLFEGRLQVESSRATRRYLEMGLALMDLQDTDPRVRMAAINTLDNDLLPVVRRSLTPLAENDPNEAVREAAQRSVRDIDTLLKVNRVAENVYYGISLGSVLLLAAIGLAITFGVMGVINMAHGEMIMLGAYTTYVVQLMMPNHIEYSILVAIPAAFMVAGLVGILIERGVIRFLYGRPLETLLATFGISLILQQAVRSIFSPLNRQVTTPEWMSGSFEINGALALTYNRFYIIIFSLLVLAALMVLLKKTHFGLQMRAVTQNRRMASAMGIRTGWVDALTFGLGSGIAGIAGVALSQLTNVGPNMGQQYIIDSFLVVVFGGVGNLWGTLVGAMSLGITNKLIEPWTGAVLAKIVILVAVILFIQKRPRGLFALKGRSVED